MMLPQGTPGGRPVVLRSADRAPCSQALTTRCAAMLSGWILQGAPGPLLARSRPYTLHIRPDEQLDGSLVVAPGGRSGDGQPLIWGLPAAGELSGQELRMPVLHQMSDALSSGVFDVVLRLRLTERPRILYMGSYQDAAGLTTFFSAVRPVISRQGEAVLLGGAAERTRLAPVAAHLGLAEHVVFAPVLAPHELAALYQSADLLIYPGQDAQNLYGLLDVYANGLPSLVADTLPARMIAGYPALLADPHQPGIWADAVQELLGNARLREQMIARGLEVSAPHLLPHVFRNWRTMIELRSGGVLARYLGGI